MLNYPTNFEEASLLELALTGIPVPEYLQKQTFTESTCELIDLDYIRPRKEPHENEKYRDSQLLQKPPKQNKEPFYKTAITAAIRMIHNGNFVIFNTIN